MNIVPIAYAVLGATGCSMFALAQQRELSMEQQVLAVDDQRNDALRRGDPAPLRDIYADDYTLVTGLGQVRTKTDQIADLTSGRLQYKDFVVKERTVRLYGDVAIVLSRQSATILMDGKPIIGGDERITRVYKLMNGKWRVISTHATSIK